MNPEEHYRKLERMYFSEGTEINTFYEGLTMSISDRKAVLTLPVTSRYFHAARAMHGSVYFKLLDDAAFFAVNSIVPDAFVLTTSFNINLLRPVTEGTLTATGTVRFVSRQLFIAESILVNEQGKEVAIGSGQFVKSKLPLSDRMGYI